jgi:hypothetical protein
MHFDGPSQLWEMEDAVEFREWRREEVRHGKHGLHDYDHLHSRF